MPSNPQASIPRKHQVIIDEMMRGETGDVGDMVKKNADKQWVIFGDMLKASRSMEEQSKQGVGFGDMLKEAGKQEVIFDVQGVVFGDMLKKQVGKQGVVFSLQGVFFSEMSKEQAGMKGLIVNDKPNMGEHNITQARGIATVRNSTLGDLQLVRGDEFAPGTIRQGGDISFVTKNSKGYVIYDGTNVQGDPVTVRGSWLSVCTMMVMVYVECGVRGNVTAMPDYQVYKNLDAFGSLATYVDAKTNTDARARIQAIGTTPKLGCVFDLGGNKS